MDSAERPPTTGFRWFWYSRVLAQSAQAAILYGLLVYLVAETDSGIWPALFVATSIVPALLFGLIGGVVADWLPQRAFMVLLSGLRGLAVIPVLRGDPSILEIFALTSAVWLIHQFYAPAESALLPRLVTQHRISRATSHYNLALPIAQLLGMVMLAPLTLKFGNLDILLICCAVLYVGAGIALLPVRAAQLPAADEAEAAPSEAHGTLIAGLRQMTADRRAFSALVDSVMIGIGLSALVVIVPQYLEDVLHTSADNTVFVFAPAAIGLVTGLQIAPLIGALIGYGRLATFGLGLFCLAILMLGVIDPITGWLEDRAILVSWSDRRLGLDPTIATTMLISIPAGFAIGLVNVAVRTVLILRTDPPAHARVFATQMTLANLGALPPTLAAGLLIDVTGVRPVAVAVGIAIASGAILGRRIGHESGPIVEGA